ncbi:MAG: hypothetical protein GYA55_06575, partial [SAR324 cluster bacterium]|nr:hypothetical protein [SAR324 cluster bacterium]
MFKGIRRRMKGLDFLNSLEQWNGQGGFCPENIKKAMNYLDNPQDKIASIHVAGTNGKGSVSAALSSILAKEGYRVGLNISPHLVRINERIVVDGYSINNELLNEAALELKDCLKKLKITLTYHEALTAIAFIVYEWKKLDWIVVEVGLGGRLDASNILNCPKACVISSIGLDHQDILGPTKAEIAKEKAGIIKKGSRLFCGRMDAESLKIFNDIAKSLGVETSSWGVSYKAEIVAKERSNGYTMRYMDLKCNEALSFKPSLKGTFQRDNMALAINVARSLNISPESCIKGVQEVFWPARFEKLDIGATSVILDCAHNIDGINALAE